MTRSKKRMGAALATCSMACLVTAWVGSTSLQAQKQAVESTTDASLQEQYDAAQRLQSTQDFAQAGFQFRLFLAEALYRIANDRAHIGEYSQAAPLFERALQLAPNHDAIRIDYAEAALTARDYSVARLIAEKQLALYPADSKTTDCEAMHRTLGRALLGMGDAQHAKDQFEDAVAIHATYGNGYDLATAYLALPDTKNAARIFAEMLAAFGDSAAIHMDFGRAYGEADFPEEAILEFKKTLAKNNTFPEAHYSLGAAYLMRSGDTGFALAEQEFHTELRLHPNDAYSYSQLGYIAMSLHHLDEAVSDLRRATELDPHNPDNFLLLGQIYSDTDRPADAIAALRSAIAVTTDPTRNHYQIRGAHYQLGHLLIQSGDLAGGRKEMKIAEDLLLQNRMLDQVYLAGKPLAGYQFPRAADDTSANPKAVAVEKDFEKRIAPAIADSYNNLGASAASEKNYPEALDDFAQAAAWNPEMEGLDYNWGRAAFAAKQYRQAADLLGRYLQAHPDASGVREPLGMSRFMIQDYNGTVDALSPLAEQLDATPLIAYAYDESLIQTDYDRGIDRMVRLEKANPNIAVLHLAIGRAYASHARDADAEVELRTALRLKPEDTDAQYVLATVLFALHRPEDATPLLETLTMEAAHQKDPELYHRIGKLQLVNGEVKSAIASLQAAEQISPKDQGIHDDLEAALHRDAPP